MNRAGWECEAARYGLGSLSPCTGDLIVHHRKLRGHGDHRDVNCLHVCAEHHTRIHANPELSYALGWMVQSWLDPEHIPVLPVALRGK